MSFLFLLSPPAAKISPLKDTPLVSTFLPFNCALCAFLEQVGIVLKRQEGENFATQPPASCTMTPLFPFFPALHSAHSLSHHRLSPSPTLAWETHISHILFQNTPRFSDAHLQLLHTHCTPCQYIGQPRFNSFKSPSFLPIFFPASGDCKVKSAPKCHQFPLLTPPPNCIFTKMMPCNTTLQPFTQQLVKSS